MSNSEEKKAERRARTKAAGLLGVAIPTRVALPCANLGGPTGQTRPCRACGEKLVAVPLLACKVYGVCTVGRAVTMEDGTPVRPCNNLCPGYSAAQL